MAYGNNARSETLLANSDLSTKQGFFLKAVSGTPRHAELASTGDRVVGVLQDKPAALGRAATVQVEGIAKVVAAGTVTAGSPVMSDSTGRAANATGSNFVAGVCEQGTVAAGEIAVVRLQL